jgi:hypothetical protein
MGSRLISLLAVFKENNMFEESVPPKHQSVLSNQETAKRSIYSPVSVV